MNLRPILYCISKLKKNDKNNNNNNNDNKNSIRIWVSYLKTRLSAKISYL